MSRSNASGKSRVYNLMVIGPNRTVRNAFIQTLSRESMGNGDSQDPNFGQIKEGTCRLNLYGVPGNPKFADLWHLFARKVEGMILVGRTGSVEDLENLNYAFSVLRKEVKGPTILVNTDPSHPHIPSDESLAGLKTFTCFPTDRQRATGILKELVSELSAAGSPC